MTENELLRFLMVREIKVRAEAARQAFTDKVQALKPQLMELFEKLSEKPDAIKDLTADELYGVLFPGFLWYANQIIADCEASSGDLDLQILN